MLNAVLDVKSTPELRLREKSKDFLSIPVTPEVWNLIRKRALYVTLSITDKCNMSCNVCFMRDNQGRSYAEEFSKEDVEFVMGKIGCKKKVLLHGGEPTLREDIGEFVNIIKKAGNIPIIYTNGIKLADLNYVKTLANLGIEKIYLSLDSLKESSTEAFCGDKEILALKLKALDNLKSVGTIKVWIAPRIAYGVNEKEIASLLDLMLKDTTNTVKGVMLLAATRNGMGKYLLPPDTAMSTSHLIRNIEMATEGVLSSEYFHEFSQLRENLNRYLNKIGASMPLSYNRVLAIREGNRLKQFIPLSDLKNMNRLFANSGIAGLGKYVYKYRRWLRLGKYIYQPTLIEFDVKDVDEIVFIGATFITDEPMHTLKTRGLLNLAKSCSSFILAGSGPY